MFAGPSGWIAEPSVLPNVVPSCTGIPRVRAILMIRSRSARGTWLALSTPRRTAPLPNGAQAKCGDSFGVSLDTNVSTL